MQNPLMLKRLHHIAAGGGGEAPTRRTRGNVIKAVFFGAKKDSRRMPTQVVFSPEMKAKGKINLMNRIHLGVSHSRQAAVAAVTLSRLQQRAKDGAAGNREI